MDKFVDELLEISLKGALEGTPNKSSAGISEVVPEETFAGESVGTPRGIRASISKHNNSGLFCFP